MTSHNKKSRGRMGFRTSRFGGSMMLSGTRVLPAPASPLSWGWSLAWFQDRCAWRLTRHISDQERMLSHPFILLVSSECLARSHVVAQKCNTWLTWNQVHLNGEDSGGQEWRAGWLLSSWLVLEISGSHSLPLNMDSNYFNYFQWYWFCGIAALGDHWNCSISQMCLHLLGSEGMPEATRPSLRCSVLILQGGLVLPFSPWFSVSPEPLAITNLLFVSMDLPVGDISYKWDHATSGLCVWLLCLVYFSVPLCCTIYQNCIPFHCWLIFHYTNISYFVDLFICWWIFGLFLLLAIMTCAAMSIRVDICFHFSRADT